MVLFGLVNLVCCQPFKVDDNPALSDESSDAKDDISSDVNDAAGANREGRRFAIHRRRLPAGYSSPFIYPAVNFIANGKPTKIFVNNKEYKGTWGVNCKL